jgi:hypothetical protein
MEMVVFKLIIDDISHCNIDLPFWGGKEQNIN